MSLSLGKNNSSRFLSLHGAHGVGGGGGGLVTKSGLTLCGPMDSSPPGSSVHRIFQARILTFSSPGDLLQPRTEPESPAWQVGSFLLSTRKALRKCR